MNDLPKQMRSKYAGVCSGCEGDISVGTPIVWFPTDRRVIHQSCPKFALPELWEPGQAKKSKSKRKKRATR